MNVPESIPSQCQKCPVIGRYLTILAHRESLLDTATNQSLHSLDESDYLADYSKDAYHFIGKVAGEMAMSTYEELEKSKEQFERVVDKIDGNCPGSTRGSGQGGLAGALDYVTGERSCHNPGFVELSNDPDIRVQLKLGNWHILNHEN